jgi:hypothetical protein
MSNEAKVTNSNLMYAKYYIFEPLNLQLLIF